MKEAIKIVESLSDVQATSLIRQLYRNIYKAVPYQKMLDNLPIGIDHVDTLKTLDQEVKKKQLNAPDSVTLAKHILRAFASDGQLSPLVLAAWEEIKDDDKLFIETIIAVGLVVNVTLFMATSEIEFKDGKFIFKKGKADADILKSIIEPVTELVKKFPVGS